MRPHASHANVRRTASRTLLAVLAGTTLLAGCLPAVVVASPSRPRYAAPLFHSELSPYGEWIHVPGAGMVWRPYAWEVGHDFRPYSTGGYWTEGELGWVFVSHWSWGRIPFHYGRWFHHPFHGWVWLPGNEWAPAWVEWRVGGGYVGWAPLPPPGWSIGVYGPSWFFVESHYFTHRSVAHYVLRDHRASVAFRYSAPLRTHVHHERGRRYAGPSSVHVYRPQAESPRVTVREQRPSPEHERRPEPRVRSSDRPAPQSPSVRPAPSRPSRGDDRGQDRGQERRPDRGARPEPRRPG